MSDRALHTIQVACAACTLTLVAFAHGPWAFALACVLGVATVTIGAWRNYGKPDE
jgi:predicted cobalt transporter CbtA